VTSASIALRLAAKLLSGGAADWAAPLSFLTNLTTLATIRSARCGAISAIGAHAFLAALSSGVPFFDRRGMCARSTTGPAFAARSSGVPFFELRGLLAAKRLASRL
jgi:hypothetical protein